MAKFSNDPICIITLDQAYPAFGMAIGDKIWVFWNDATRATVVQLEHFGPPGPPDVFTTITDGPDLNGFVGHNLIENVYVDDSGNGGTITA